MTMDKMEMIKAILANRIEITRKGYTAAKGDDRAWYAGKQSGYLDALDLLNSSEKSIGVELCSSKPMRNVGFTVSELETIARNGVETR